jgi:hypothetical protein
MSPSQVSGHFSPEARRVPTRSPPVPAAPPEGQETAPPSRRRAFAGTQWGWPLACSPEAGDAGVGSMTGHCRRGATTAFGRRPGHPSTEGGRHMAPASSLRIRADMKSVDFQQSFLAAIRRGVAASPNCHHPHCYSPLPDPRRRRGQPPSLPVLTHLGRDARLGHQPTDRWLVCDPLN